MNQFNTWWVVIHSLPRHQMQGNYYAIQRRRLSGVNTIERLTLVSAKSSRLAKSRSRIMTALKQDSNSTKHTTWRRNVKCNKRIWQADNMRYGQANPWFLIMSRASTWSKKSNATRRVLEEDIAVINCTWQIVTNCIHSRLESPQGWLERSLVCLIFASRRPTTRRKRPAKEIIRRR